MSVGKIQTFSGQYNDLSSKPDLTLKQNTSKFPYLSYQFKISQAATSAPTVTEYINELGTTFTFGRTSAGLYTITADSGTPFTANKTHILIDPPALDLVTFKIVKTSTSILTITTGLSSVIATVLTSVSTDVLLSNTLIEIRVYN